MSRFVFASCFLALAVVASAQDNCVECHLELEESSLSEPARAMREDVHASAGLSCASCHGGDPEVRVVDGEYRRAKGPGTGYIGTPEPTAIPSLCGRCHADASYMHNFDPNIPTDQLAQYWTSVHGQKLREGAKEVAQCSSCHRSHGVLPATDPRSPVYVTRVAGTCGRCHADADYMKAYNIPTDQLEAYRASVHGRALFDKGDLGAPTCNSCHGNHGAAPPGFTSVSLVCGNCHSIQTELFASSTHKEVFDDLGEPECEVCHGNHEVEAASDEMLGVEEGSICLDCHGEGERAYTVAKTLREELESLKKFMQVAGEIVDGASRAGMEVSEAEMALIDANQALVQARNLVHTFSVERLVEKVSEGRTICTAAEEMGRTAWTELNFRRKGLAASLVVILLMVVGLYLKIRDIEGRG